MMNIILIGPPGSGKGTQATLLSKKFKLANISTGEVLRKEVNKGSDIGLIAKSYLDSGELVPDEIILKIIAERIIREDCKNGFIMDGFPRNKAQAHKLNEMLTKISKSIDFILFFEIDESVIQKRLKSRQYCKACNAVNSVPISFLDLNNKNLLKCAFCGASEGFSTRTDDNQEVIRTRLEVYRSTSEDLKSYYNLNYSNVRIINADQPPSEVEREIEKILS